tara:strand:+ start:452 stop:634 length:183 start_codon:yes stop_codon:yes gene_type:complete
MGDIIPLTNDISYGQALLWCLYPIGALVGAELFLRAANNDDDDDDEGGGVMSPVGVYQGA